MNTNRMCSQYDARRIKIDTSIFRPSWSPNPGLDSNFLSFVSKFSLRNLTKSSVAAMSPWIYKNKIATNNSCSFFLLINTRESALVSFRLMFVSIISNFLFQYLGACFNPFRLRWSFQAYVLLSVASFRGCRVGIPSFFGSRLVSGYFWDTDIWWVTILL